MADKRLIPVAEIRNSALRQLADREVRDDCTGAFWWRLAYTEAPCARCAARQGLVQGPKGVREALAAPFCDYGDPACPSYVEPFRVQRVLTDDDRFKRFLTWLLLISGLTLPVTLRAHAQNVDDIRLLGPQGVLVATGSVVLLGIVIALAATALQLLELVWRKITWRSARPGRNPIFFMGLWRQLWMGGVPLGTNLTVALWLLAVAVVCLVCAVMGWA